MSLILGATGSGKTLILKRLEIASAFAKNGLDFHFEEMPTTISTVGTNLVTVPVGRRQEVTVRELGGCMGPIWKNYLTDSNSLMYVVDVSNRLQVAASCIQLLNLLSSSNLPAIPVLLIFNKIDMPDTLSQSELESLFHLKDIVQSCNRPLQTLEVSACTGKGLGKIITWLEQNATGK
ncbi:ADP-ribosylation factor-like protein 16 [Dreissena polymorpha]|uniref:ADP-ribosylation factor-like protein 16 n=1 Tax=Dreissena polymorpha TaxID=45954 RepID=A0A9D4LUS2_DREPO|nr:ADP-ribosylation factor-like protein 16 [Dreissena polymorpha]KAH3864138.1 hypothetical protein DPMN_027152 [Dreissena polymorpha]